MMKQRFHSIVIIILFAGVGSLGYAQSTGDCVACQATPAPIVQYQNMIQNLIATMTASYDQQSPAPTAPFAGLIQGGILQLRNQNLLEKVRTTARDRSVQHATLLSNTARITSKSLIHTIDNTTRIMVLAYFNTALRRDIQAIQSLDPTIDTVSLDIGRRGIAFQTISNSTEEQLNAVLDQYINTGLVDSSSTLRNPTYNQIITIINQLQSQVKEGIAISNQQAIDNRTDNTISASQGLSVISLSPQTKTDIFNAYACVRTQVCNSNTTGIKNIADAFVQGSTEMGDSVQGFVDGIARLKEHFAKGGGRSEIQSPTDRFVFTGRSDPFFRQSWRESARNQEIRENTNNTQLTQGGIIRVSSRTPEITVDRSDTLNIRSDTTTNTHALTVISTPIDHNQLIAQSATILYFSIQGVTNTFNHLATTCELQCSNKSSKCRPI